MSTPAPVKPAPAASAEELRVAARALVEVARLGAQAFGREDREAVHVRALARIDRPETVIAVIGEFKQGKSSLVNSLLEADVAPVDDDIATAVLTLFRYAAAPSAALVTEAESGDEVFEEIAFEDFPRLVSEQTNPENRARAARIEVKLASAFLRTGAVLVDTPGFGGLSPAYGGMTLAYLRSVDAVIFASDSSAPLSRPELDFLKRAIANCPAVLMALTKIDLYPGWRAMAQIAETTLTAEQIDVPVLCVSSDLAAYARAAANAAVLAQSGIPDLTETLTSLVVDAARLQACRRAIDEASDTVTQLRATASAELQALEDPAGVESTTSELAAARARLEQLRGPGSRWTQVLGDGFSDLAGEADFHFRAAMRELTRSFEDEIETGGDPGRHWDEMTARLRARVAEAADRMLVELDTGSKAISSRIVELLADDEGIELRGSAAAPLNVADLWSARPLERVGVGKATDLTFAGIRGGQSGVSTIKLVASLAGIGVGAAATAGFGILFVGKQLMDERKRHLQGKRQQARTAIRQFSDDVQFEASKRMRDLTRDLQRAQRDYFSDHILELQRTATDAYNGVQAALEKSAAERQAAARTNRERLGQLDELAQRMTQIASAL